MFCSAEMIRSKIDVLAHLQGELGVHMQGLQVQELQVQLELLQSIAHTHKRYRHIYFVVCYHTS